MIIISDLSGSLGQRSLCVSVCVGVSNSAFCHLMEFTYTATLALSGQEEVMDVWRAAEYLQMQEAIKALNNRLHSVLFS